MGIDISLFLAVFFMIIAWAGVLVRLVLRKRLDLIDWFVGALGFTNGACYIVVLIATYQGLNTTRWGKALLSFESSFWLVPVLGLIGIIGAWLGGFLWPIGSKNFPLFKIVSSGTLDIKEQFIEKMAWIFLLLAFICYYQYTRAYGGFFQLLNYSSLIRSGLFDLIGVQNRWSFLKPFGGFAFFSSFLFFALILKNCINRRFIKGLGLVLSFLFSIYVLYSWRGRVGFVKYLSVFSLGYIFCRFGYGYKSLVRISLIIMLLIFILSPLSFLMTPGKASDNLASFYAKELSYPFASLFSAVDKSEYRYGRDVFHAPLYFMPERIWGPMLNLDTASTINTERIMGARKGEDGVTGSIPVDFITFWYMQLGIYGVAIGSFLWGILLRWVDGIICNVNSKELRALFYAHIVLSFAMQTSLYADPRHIITRNFYFLCGFFMLMAHSLIRKNIFYRY
jgi:hypothetical protein